MLLQSFKAGAFIALGCILYLLAPNEIIGAALFSVGLLGVISTKACLYTGQVHCLIEGDRTIFDMPIILLLNLIGVMFTIIFIPLLGGMEELINKAE